MTNKHMTRGSVSFIIKEMQVSALRYQVTDIRMTTIKKTEFECWHRCGVIGTPVCY